MLTKERVFEIMGSFYGNDHYRSAIAQNTPEADLAVITETLDRVNALGYRVCNIHALENAEDVRLAPILLDAFDRLSAENRRAGAIGVLRRRCYAPFVPELIRRYEETDSASLRSAITDALFGIGSRKHIPDYLRLVRGNGYGESPDYLLDLLCKLRVREAVPVLLSLHAQNPQDWKWTLLKYAPATGKPELIPAIRPYLGCDDRELRTMAEKAMKKLDVCVTFADGQNCTFVFATPQNLLTLMEREGTSYFQPGLPFLFVKELTEENIRACLDAISDDRAAKNIYGAQIWNLMEEWRQEP